ncbi:hypothetical protein ACFPRL_11105 [Pseudoclavibacter helvolus]
MTAGEQRDEEPVDGSLLPDDRLCDFTADTLQGFTDIGAHTGPPEFSAVVLGFVVLVGVEAGVR